MKRFNGKKLEKLLNTNKYGIVFDYQKTQKSLTTDDAFTLAQFEVYDLKGLKVTYWPSYYKHGDGYTFAYGATIFNPIQTISLNNFVTPTNKDIHIKMVMFSKLDEDIEELFKEYIEYLNDGVDILQSMVKTQQEVSKRLKVKEDELYQQRLDKVLSNFVSVIDEKYYYLLETNLSIAYKNNKFYIEGQEVYDSVNISLKTVESILEDLDNGISK